MGRAHPMAISEAGGGDAPLEPVETNRPAVSGPSMVASEPVEPSHHTSSRPSMVAPELVEIGHPTPSEPLVLPSKSVGGGHVDSFKPSKPREGSKMQHADEEQSGSGKPAPKHPRMMASR